ncbi:MAG: ribbon-helix-helix domain-containing protein [Anaerolineae bacterium]|nr:ribbon-helix-helix domain-containing protein [Anaerolineae bacterium]
MIRTQIQLTEEQSRTLKEMAQERGVSMAELIRQSIENFIRARNQLTREEKRRKALAIMGQFSSGVSDLSTNHDQYLAEAYGDFGE